MGGSRIDQETSGFRVKARRISCCLSRSDGSSGNGWYRRMLVKISRNPRSCNKAFPKRKYRAR